MTSLQLNTLDSVAILLFFAGLSVVGFLAGRGETASSRDYFLAGNRLPWYVVGGSLVASVLSTEHLIGMVGWAVLYGISIGMWSWALITDITLLVFLWLPFRMVLNGETRDFLRAAGTLHWGLMAFVFALSHLAYLLVLPERAGDALTGPGLLLYLVMLTQLNDVAQYVSGKRFGRTKALPSVSPNKTIEGVLGGVVTTTLLSVLIAPLLTPLSMPHAIACGLMISMAGFVGDVTISAVKRDLGIKDTGSLIPGHGGVLDRLDSLLYTAPLFFHFMKYFYY